MEEQVPWKEQGRMTLSLKWHIPVLLFLAGTLWIPKIQIYFHESLGRILPVISCVLAVLFWGFMCG